MSVVETASVHRTPRPLVMATALAAAAGVAFGATVTSDTPEPPKPQAPAKPGVGLERGVAKLPLPAGWQPLGRLSTLPGLEQATAVRGVDAELALDIRAPESASLLPARLAATVEGGLPEPQVESVGGRAVWRYELPGGRPGTQLVAFALPTTGGIVTFACQPNGAATGVAEAECEQAVRAVRLDGAAALAPRPETAARIVLPRTMAELNRRRSSGRRRLGVTQSPQDRSAAARRLAGGYAAAAERLRPLAAGDAIRFTATLEAQARRHRALARASLHRNVRAARRVGAAIERGERLLATLLARLTAS